MKSQIFLATILAIILCLYNNSGVVLGEISNTWTSQKFTCEVPTKKSIDEYTAKMNRVKDISSVHNSTISDSVIYAIVEMSYKHKILSVELICSVITFETKWKPKAISTKGALGIMQIMPSTGKDLAKQEGIKTSVNMLYNPVINIKLGCSFLNQLVSKYGIKPGLAGYNGGEVRAQLAHKGLYEQLPKETQEYVKGVSTLYNEYTARTQHSL